LGLNAEGIEASVRERFGDCLQAADPDSKGLKLVS
jgi:hypothetical protein